MTVIDVAFNTTVPLAGQITAMVSTPAAVSFAAAIQFDAGGTIGVIAVPVSPTGAFTVSATDLAKPKARLVVAAVPIPPTPGTATIDLQQGGASIPVVAPPGISLPVTIPLANMPAQFF